jgi:hypothetical protein
VNIKALLPHRDTNSTMTCSAFTAAQLYIFGTRDGMPHVSKPGENMGFAALCPNRLQRY